MVRLGLWDKEVIPEETERRLKKRRNLAEKSNDFGTVIGADYLLSNWDIVGDEVYHGTHWNSAIEILEDEEIVPGIENDSVTGERSNCSNVSGTSLVPAAIHYSKKSWPYSLEIEYEAVKDHLDAGNNLPSTEEYTNSEREILNEFLDEYVDWWSHFSSTNYETKVYNPDESQKSERQLLAKEADEKGYETNPNTKLLGNIRAIQKQTDGFEEIPTNNNGHVALLTVIGFDRDSMVNARSRPDMEDIMFRDEYEAMSYSPDAVGNIDPISEIQADKVNLDNATVYVEGDVFLDGNEFDENAVREFIPNADIVPLEALEMKHEEFMRHKYREGGFDSKGGTIDYGSGSFHNPYLNPQRNPEDYNDDPRKIDISN